MPNIDSYELEILSAYQKDKPKSAATKASAGEAPDVPHGLPGMQVST